MAVLKSMPALVVGPAELRAHGETWQRAGGRLDTKASIALGGVFNTVIGRALATMLGDIPTVSGRLNRLSPYVPGAKAGTGSPKDPDCVELGSVLVVGGVRPQYFDVGYRPDGIRFAADVKTLNDTDSVGKNYANMINDLTAEATTVHMRFPHAVVAFLVAIPKPSLKEPQVSALIRRLEGLGRREDVDGAPQLAEVISFVVWEPSTGEVDAGIPPKESSLRVERFSERVERIYVARYEGSQPHLQKGARVAVAATESGEVAEVEADDDDAGETPAPAN